MTAKANPAQDWTWFQKGEIASAIHTCRRLFSIGMLSGVYPAEAERAMLTLLLINLNDLLQKMRSDGHPCVFAEDIHPACNAASVTELVNNTRNAACHLNSGQHLHAGNKFTYMVARGYFPNFMVLNNVVFGCNYPDDTAVMFGSNVVYLKRHLRRSLDAAEAYFRATGARKEH